MIGLLATFASYLELGELFSFFKQFSSKPSDFVAYWGGKYYDWPSCIFFTLFVYYFDIARELTCFIACFEVI